MSHLPYCFLVFLCFYKIIVTFQKKIVEIYILSVAVRHIKRSKGIHQKEHTLKNKEKIRYKRIIPTRTGPPITIWKLTNQKIARLLVSLKSLQSHCQSSTQVETCPELRKKDTWSHWSKMESPRALFRRVYPRNCYKRIALYHQTLLKRGSHKSIKSFKDVHLCLIKLHTLTCLENIKTTTPLLRKTPPILAGPNFSRAAPFR